MEVGRPPAVYTVTKIILRPACCMVDAILIHSSEWRVEARTIESTTAVHGQQLAVMADQPGDNQCNQSALCVPHQLIID
jgi:hypothetical protein